MDQQINYRVNIDDAGFQAKLTQMRASLDQTVMGQQLMGGMGGGMGLSPTSMYAMAGGMQNQQMGLGGYAPIGYTPPAIATEPHFGMYAVRQTFAQSLAGAAGMTSIFSPWATFRQPTSMTPMDYAADSQRNLMNRIEDVKTVAKGTAVSMGSQIAFGAAGAALGSALIPIPFVGAMLGEMAGQTFGEHVAAPITKAMVQQSALRRDLMNETFRNVTGGPDVDPLTGRGLNFTAARKLSEQLTNATFEPGMSALSVGQMREITTKGIEMGLFRGDDTADKMLDKSKELAKAVQEVAATLHTSFSSALETINTIRQTTGTAGPGSIQKAVEQITSSAVASRMAGTTPGEMIQAGVTGAAIVQGTGLSMSTYSEVNKLNTSFVKQFQDTNPQAAQIAINQAGGTAAALSQQMTAAQAGFEQSDMGRMAKLAAYDPKTGKLDLDRIKGKSFDQLAQMAGRIHGRDMAKFIAHEAELTKDMAPEDVQMMQARTFQAMGEKLERQGIAYKGEGTRLAMKQYGLSEEVINTELDMLRPKTKEELEKIASQKDMQTRREIASERSQAEATRTGLGPEFFSGVGKAKKYLSDVSSSVGGSIANARDSVIRALTGQDTVDYNHLYRASQ
jgi:hypothetical protein